MTFALLMTTAIVTQLSLKDLPPPQLPTPHPAHQQTLRIDGLTGTFRVPLRIMQRYHLHDGQSISPILARLIAAELGYDYPAQLRVILQDLDERERKP